jgi:hypothetical protein
VLQYQCCHALDGRWYLAWVAVVDQSQRTIFRGMGIFNNIYLDRWYIGSDESDKDVRIAS